MSNFRGQKTNFEKIFQELLKKARISSVEQLRENLFFLKQVSKLLVLDENSLLPLRKIDH